MTRSTTRLAALERAQTPQEIDILAKIERLADLQRKGIVSPEEFAAKKAELLSRL
jgi:putative oligomerization/nucleic acid binding protein